MAAILTWYKDNSMVVTVTITDSAGSAVTGATATGTLLDATGATTWTDTLTNTSANIYSATIHPASAVVSAGGRYTLRVAATKSGASLEFEDYVDVVDRTSS